MSRPADYICYWGCYVEFRKPLRVHATLRIASCLLQWFVDRPRQIHNLLDDCKYSSLVLIWCCLKLYTAFFKPTTYLQLAESSESSMCYKLVRRRDSKTAASLCRCECLWSICTIRCENTWPNISIARCHF